MTDAGKRLITAANECKPITTAAEMKEAAIEACSNVIKNYDVMDASGTKYLPLKTQKAAKGLVAIAREDISAIPCAEPAPNWERFGRDLLDEWPVRDIDGAELFETALRNGLVIEVPGGYDPEQHIDAEGICPETGDPWYEYAFDAPAPLTLQAALEVPEVKAMVDALSYYADAKTYEPDKTYANQPWPIFDDEGALARAALAAIEGAGE